jgi:hypothetical protein
MIFRCYKTLFSGPGSSVGIETGYGLDGPGMEFRWGRDFPHLSRPAHPASCTMGNGSFPGVESGRGVTQSPHPFIVPRSKISVELVKICLKNQQMQ